MANIIKKVISNEKSVRMMETENKLVFLVDKKSKKDEIKKQLEELFKVKIEKINTMVSPKGEKKAYVKFNQDTLAIDIATQLGIM